MAEKNPYVEKAYEKLVHISADEEKRLEYEAREKAIRDHNYLMKSNREEGKVEGIREGKLQGRREAKIEAVLELLEELGQVPQSLQETILAQTDMEILKEWHKLAAKSDSIEVFLKAISLGT